MTLKEFGIELKQELLANGSLENIKIIAERINKATINGKALTDAQKDELLGCIFNDYAQSGSRRLNESDNSEWLKAMSTLRALLNKTSK